MSHVKHKVCSVCKVQKLASECVKDRNICKSCKAIKAKAYRADNQDKSKAYRADNQDKRKAYLAANRESRLEKMKAYRAANQDKRKAWLAANRESIREQQKAWNLKNKFGISLETYRQMEVDQNYCCKICNVPRDRLKMSLAVDHNHMTGQVRALLCKMCNTGLGSAMDSIIILKSLISYLESYE